MKTQRERQEERRRERLAVVEDQVRSGSLIIRQMTEAERARYPARERKANRRGSSVRVDPVQRQRAMRMPSSSSTV